MIDNPRTWRFYADGEIIDHPRYYDTGYVVIDPEIEEELNSHGSLKFTIANTHPLYSTIKQIGTIITAYNGEDEVFRGRVAETTRDFYNNLEVYCEGQLAFFCDSVMQPFAFKGSVTEFLSMLLDNHNSQVDATRQFTLGTVTVTDPDNNGVLVRSSDSALTTWEIISGRLLDSLGGYLLIRKGKTTHYIDYLADISTVSDGAQTIQFAENLLDLEEYISAEDVVTVLMPFGAKIEEDGTNANDTDKYQEEPEASGTTLWHGNRVTIRSVNNGEYYVEDADGVALWGRIWGTNVWDDVTEPANLLTKAKAWLKDNIKSSTTMTLTAVDLHLVDVDIERIHLGDFVRVYSRPHNLNRYMSCIKVHTEPKHPDNSSVTLGATVQTLTRSLAGGKGLETRVLTLEGDSEYTAAAVSENRHSITNARKAVDELSTKVTSIENLEADSAFVKNLDAKYATVENLEAANANITSLQTDKLDADTAKATYATIENLNATNEKVTNLEAADVTITGNLEAANANITSLQTNKADITDLNATTARVTTLETVNTDVKNRLTAAEGNITTLTSQKASIADLEAANAEIANLKTDKLDVSVASAQYATIDNLNAANGSITNLQTDVANIKELTTDTEFVKNLNAQYANIDFSNIGIAAVKELFSQSGIIENLTTESGTVTGRLVGVTIQGDLIEANTIAADKLVVLGDDGLYYKLNVNALGETTASADEKYQSGLDGSVIIAQSITADRISVSDLVAFGATIGGFHITDNALYSGAKAGAISTTRGVYLDSTGQLSAGDASKYLRYYQDTNGTWKLEIQADVVKIGSSNTSIESTLTSLQNIADNAIESWTGTTAPTASNAPASSWTDAATKKQHSGDIYYNTTTGYSYRWGSTDGTNYSWMLIKDTDITTAVQTANSAASNASSALSKANTADTNASAAVSTANSANATATTAASNASAAVSTANSASATAKTASDNASAAVSTANTANSTANTAKNTADAAKSAADTATSNVATLTETVTTHTTSIDKLEDEILLKASSSEVQSIYEKLGTPNLLLGTSDEWSDWVTPKPNISNSVTSYYYFSQGALEAYQSADQWLYFSMEIEFSGVTSSSLDAFGIISQDAIFSSNGSGRWNSFAIHHKMSLKSPPTDGVYIYKGSYHNTRAISTTPASGRMEIRCDYWDSGKYRIRKVKLELGDEGTPWCPAAEDLTALSTRVTNAETSIKTNADEIALRATKETVDALTERVSTAETNITQTSEAITLEAKSREEAVNNAISAAAEDATTKADTAYSNAISTVNKTLENYATLTVTDNKISSAVSTSEKTVKEYADGQADTAYSNAKSYVDQTATSLTTTIGSVSDVANANIKSAQTLFYASNSTTAPSPPTAQVTTSSTSTRNAWNLSCPSYSGGYPYLYTCQQLMTSSGDYLWTEVTQSSYAREISKIASTASGAASNADKARTEAAKAQSTANDGIASQVTLFYASASSDAGAISLPSEAVDTANDVTEAWTQVLPSYDATAPYLYTCQQLKTNGGDYSWTEIVASAYSDYIDGAYSQITQLKDSIKLTVTDGTPGNTAQIKLTVGTATQTGEIDMSGVVTVSDLKTGGSTEINGDNITTGTISADRLNVDDIFAKDITAKGNINFSNDYYELLGSTSGVFINAKNSASNYISLKGNRVLLQGLESDVSARLLVSPESDSVLIDADDNVTIEATTITLNGEIASGSGGLTTVYPVTISNTLTANAVITNRVAPISDTIGVNIDGATTVTGALTANSSLVANGGQVEIYAPTTVPTPYIDFHYNNSSDDYTSRIIESASGTINVIATKGVQANGKQVLTIYSSSSGNPNGTWRYLQYGNSKGSVFTKECWINLKNQTPTNVSEISSGLYFGYMPAISFPFTFSSIPVVNVNIWLNGYAVMTVLASVTTSGIKTSSGGSGLYILGFTDLSKHSFNVSVHVVGN